MFKINQPKNTSSAKTTFFKNQKLKVETKHCSITLTNLLHEHVAQSTVGSWLFNTQNNQRLKGKFKNSNIK